MRISRRSLLHAGVWLAAGRSAAALSGEHSQRAPLTAAAVIARIKERVGIPWRTETVDRIVAGAPTTAVTGIATTMMATLTVLQRAAAAGRNMVITHEPTFFSHQDGTDTLKQDPAFQFKDQFIREHELVVFRFHDHWHAMRPDGIATGMARELGWEKNIEGGNPRQFTFPETPLSALARDVTTRLRIQTMRVIGPRDLAVKRVAASWGYYTFNPATIPLLRSDIDLFIVGETREWETVEYVQDLVASGQEKGLIVLGHVVSEQSGMKYCAEWLRGFVGEVPVEFVPAEEPFWRPDAPAR
jgi:putative NIF3 family GTP cyclohydrolase 1 type 2